MKIVCVSASNVRHAGEASTSLRVCRLLGDLIHRHDSGAAVETVRLVDYDLKPCVGCGKCFRVGRCAEDEAFNEVYSRLVGADGLFVVSAHYAPIPARLSMLLEKVEQLAFLPRFHDAERRSPLYRKPVGIVGHGGGIEDLYLLEAFQVAYLPGWVPEREFAVVLQDSETNQRYEVEIQLGATDESHIIRTIEYWDIERKRYPQYDHCAAIVAEDITSRFLNVISLFNGFIPSSPSS